MKNDLLICCVVLSLLTFVGCAPELQTSKQIYPGKSSLGASINALKQNGGKQLSLAASGDFFLKFYDDKGKSHNENFPIKLWLKTPHQLYLQGDAGFDGRAVVLGSNESEFWLSIKPQISSYWWGKWSQQGGRQNLKISPTMVLEAISASNIETSGQWVLTNNRGMDILSSPYKRIYINTRDYTPAKIEYLNTEGKVSVEIKLSSYKKIAESTSVPTDITINSFSGGKGADEFKIILKSVKPYEFSQEKLRIFFDRPQPKGIEHIYQIINGRIIEQKF